MVPGLAEDLPDDSDLLPPLHDSVHTEQPISLRPRARALDLALDQPLQANASEARPFSNSMCRFQAGRCAGHGQFFPI